MISFLFRVVDRNPAHVRVSVFAGRTVGSRANAGVLTFRTEEWAKLCDVFRLHGDPGATSSIEIEEQICGFRSPRGRRCDHSEDRHETDDKGRVYCVPCWGGEEDDGEDMAYHAFVPAAVPA